MQRYKILLKFRLFCIVALLLVCRNIHMAQRHDGFRAMPSAAFLCGAKRQADKERVLHCRRPHRHGLEQAKHRVKDRQCSGVTEAATPALSSPSPRVPNARSSSVFLRVAPHPLITATHVTGYRNQNHYTLFFLTD